MKTSIHNPWRMGAIPLDLEEAGRWITCFTSDWKGYNSTDFYKVSNTEGHVRAKTKPYDGCESSGLLALPT